MFSFIRNLFKRRSLIEKMGNDHYCPFCESKGRLLAGPSGGLSVNVICGDCGAKYNFHGILGQGLFGIDLIHGPTDPTPNYVPAVSHPSLTKVEKVEEKFEGGLRYGKS